MLNCEVVLDWMPAIRVRIVLNLVVHLIFLICFAFYLHYLLTVLAFILHIMFTYATNYQTKFLIPVNVFGNKLDSDYSTNPLCYLTDLQSPTESKLSVSFFPFHSVSDTFRHLKHENRSLNGSWPTASPCGALESWSDTRDSISCRKIIIDHFKRFIKESGPGSRLFCQEIAANETQQNVPTKP